MQEKIYKTPLKKLAKFFESSRDGWKIKYFETKKELKRLLNRIYDLENRKDFWKERALGAEKKVDELNEKLLQEESKKKSIQVTKIEKPANYTYSLDCICTFIKLVLEFSLSMNSARKILRLIYPQMKKTPSINTGKTWMLKFGYYKLMLEAKEKAKDLIWIMDHTIQMGKEKCLVVLGIPVKDLPKNRALTYKDVEVIDLQPVPTSTGDIVYQQSKDIAKEIGFPRAVTSDMGSDIKNGVLKLIEISPNTVHIYDLKHKIAILVKKTLEPDIQWAEFKKFANWIVKKLQNTTSAGYRPPAQRNKARYMNIEKLVKWAEQILIKYENLKQQKEKTPEEIKLETILADIIKFEEDIKAWSEMVNIISSIERFMNIHNLQSDSYEKFHELHSNKLEQLQTPKAQKLSTEILDFIKEQQKVCKKGERLLHSSEILESLFGKFKWLEKEQSNASFTNLLLAIPAMTSEITKSVVKIAMEKVDDLSIKKWTKEKIGITIQAQRKELYNLKKIE